MGSSAAPVRHVLRQFLRQFLRHVPSTALPGARRFGDTVMATG